MRRPHPLALHAAASLILIAIVYGCAPRRPVTAAVVEPPSTRDIEQLIERGCFRCLEQALSLAEERGQASLAFESAALLALRATELGMPADAWMAKARALADGNPTWQPYLEMVAAVPPDPLRGLRDDLLVETKARNQARASLPLWYDVVKTASLSLPFRAYVHVALICGVDITPERGDRLTALAGEVPEIPLLTYRIGICDGRYRSQLEALQTRVPEFVDADLTLGRYELQGPKAPDQDAALRRFRSAAAAFPSSTSIPTAIGNLYQSWEDRANALVAYDTALTLLPSHPDALLGRVISLSYLERHQEAIATATQLIDQGRWHLGQAFYWRAWNHFNAGDNQAARVDADRTRTLMVNPAVFLLSGLIEWRFRRVEQAEKEFQEAITMDFGQCEAAFYLGGTRSELRKRPEAIAAMNQARQCYDLSIAVRRKAFDEMMAGPGTPESKARESARHERAIASVQKRRDEVTNALAVLTKAPSTR
jgi:tetratricopeptide (TPR) repeat protein